MNTPTTKSVPGRRSPWIVDIVLEMQRKGFLGFITDVWKEHGDFAEIRIGSHSMYLAVHPEHVRHISITNRGNYDKRSSYDTVRKLLLGDGLVTSNGELWRRQRKLMSPFFTPRSIEAYASTILNDGQALYERWESLADSQQTVEISDEMMRVTATIILRAMFSSESDEELLAMKRAVETMIQFTVRYEMNPFSLPLWLPTAPNRGYQAARSLVHEFIQRMISNRRRLPDEQWPDDLLSRLLRARDEVSGAPIPEYLLRDEMITIFFAGHETTARTLTFMWYELSQHPQVAIRLHGELDDVLQGRPPALDDLHRLTYTLQVIKETLRLYPPAPVYIRDVVNDDVICGMPVPAGGRILLAPYLTHRHPEFWNEPETFDPERWSPEKEAAQHPYAYHPFAAGQRICLGNHFALQEAHLLTALLARGFAPRSIPGHRVQLDMAGTLISRNGVPMVIERSRRM